MLSNADVILLTICGSPQAKEKEEKAFKNIKNKTQVHNLKNVFFVHRIIPFIIILFS